jgi:cell wall-active antibiotic response 4TMS protein YvqF
VSTIETIPRVEPRVPTTQPKRSRFGSFLGGAVLVLLGGLWALDLAGAIDVRLAVVLPSLLIIFGLALVVGATEGPHSGLVVAGLFLSIAVVIAAAVPATSLSGGVGERQFRVTQQTSLASIYQVGVGDLRLDLRDLDMVESAEVAVSAGAGQITVLLPESVPVDITASSGAGQVNLLGETSEGLAVSREYTSESFDGAGIRLTLVIDVAAGTIEVTR